MGLTKDQIRRIAMWGCQEDIKAILESYDDIADAYDADKDMVRKEIYGILQDVRALVSAKYAPSNAIVATIDFRRVDGDLRVTYKRKEWGEKSVVAYTDDIGSASRILRSLAREYACPNGQVEIAAIEIFEGGEWVAWHNPDGN